MFASTAIDAPDNTRSVTVSDLESDVAAAPEDAMMEWAMGEKQGQDSRKLLLVRFEPNKSIGWSIHGSSSA